ncbi:TetR/AcrR family transcriptional regulator [Paenibacillus chitinolyticus]|uniref:TetR/AcrR family transcriptional regulator n=1 Tax=Paenibacillus chitinolyticus TaxID=79263 RepID=UPI002DBCCF3B|nr:TetR/AcrR family transcriptional regulator [Paenibacillus chitinolyticus]MEC0244566.1 TetR/AcrR family transcriptional regulator [Paenibacillus chitinolyticus]
MDRRILKSKEAIVEAFIGLMAEKNFEQVTINEIANRANVSRGTVYLHYTDKFDLLDQCIKFHLVQLIDSFLPCGVTGIFPSKASLLHTFQYLGQHAFFYTAVLTNKGVPMFRDRLKAALLRGLDKQIDMDGINRDMNKEMLVQFLASAIGGMIEWWITDPMPYSEADMVEQLWALMERNQMVPQPLNQ